MLEIQDNIKTIVEYYKRNFPEEYAQVCVQNQAKRDSLKNKWAELEGDHVQKRLLFEYPERLYNAMSSLLGDEERAWLSGYKGTKWMGDTYPEFRITFKI